MKKNKNLLPPFLMIRSGLLNDLILAAGLVGGVCIADATLSDKQSIGYASLMVFVIAFLIASVKTAAKKDYMRQDIEQVIEQMQDFKNDNCDMRFGMVHFPRLAQRLVRYMSKKDNAYFDKLVQNPKAVQNNVVERDIVIGHLQANPGDAKLLKDMSIDIESLPRRLYRKVMRANKSK